MFNQKEYKRNYDKAYSEKHKTHIKARQKEWRFENKDRLRVKNTKYHSRDKIRYLALQNVAKRKNIELSITLEQYENIDRTVCFYCDSPTNLARGYGLDRKDNAGPYSLENVVPCCRRCNTIKMNVLTFEEMLIIMKALKDYWAKEER